MTARAIMRFFGWLVLVIIAAVVATFLRVA